MEQLEEENRVLEERIVGLEDELARRDQLLKETTELKNKLHSDVKDGQKRIKELMRQLENAEDAEYHAKGLADEIRTTSQHKEIQFKEEQELLQLRLKELQGKININNTKYEDLEEKYYIVVAELQDKSSLFNTLEKDHERSVSEASSRLANLNQTLLQTKQLLGQLDAQNDELKEQELMLLKENEILEKRCTDLALKLESPCQFCKSIQQQVLSKKQDVGIPQSISTPVTPFKPLPEQTEVARLQEENTKLKEKYDCLFVNYQMVSDKSAQLKKTMKGSEKSLTELEAACDSLRIEKEETIERFEKTKQILQAYQEKESVLKSKHDQLKSDSEILMKELSEIQLKNDELLTKNDSLQSDLETTHNTVSNLKSQISTLKQEKLENQESLNEARSHLDELMEEISSYKQSSAGSFQSSLQESEIIASYKRKLADVEKEKEELKIGIDKSQSMLAVMEEEKTGLLATIKKLQETEQNFEIQKQQSLEIKQASLSAVEEIVNLQGKLTSLNEKTEEAVEENEILTSKLNKHHSQIAELETSLAKHREDSKFKEETISELQKALESYQSKEVDMMEELSSTRQTVESLTKQFKQIKKELKEAGRTNSCLEREMVQCRMRIDELESEKFELESYLKEKSNQEYVNESINVEMDSKVKELSLKLSATEAVLYEKESLLNEVTISRDLLEKENTAMIRQLDHLSLSLMHRNAEADDLKSQVNRYEQETSEIAAQVSELEVIHMDCSGVRSRLELELDQVKEELANAQDCLAVRKVELSSALLENKRFDDTRMNLEKKIKELERKIDSLVKKNEELSTQVERKEEQLLELTSHIKNKSELLRTADKENVRLRNENQETQMKYSNQLETNEAKYYNLKEQHDALLAEKREDFLTMSQLKANIDELEHANSEILKEKRQLINQIDDLKEEKSSLQKEFDSLSAMWKDAKRDIKYQKRKLNEKEKCYEQYADTIREFKTLRDEALNILEPSTPKGILRKKSSRSVEDELKLL
jgi:chromosome segregation ATPase